MKADVVIIGGGIAGLYAAYKCILKNKSVIVLEKSMRLGGRIRTIYEPYQYEAGAARFHEKHVIIRKLLKTFGLHEVPIRTKKTYEGKPSPEKKLVEEVLHYANHLEKRFLHHILFIDLCKYVLGEQKTTLLQNAFGYNAEFEQLNAYDGMIMFQKDFSTNSKYFICTEGLSALVGKLEEIIGMPNICLNVRVSHVQKLKNGTFCIIAKDVLGKTLEYYAETVVCALPKNDMEGLKLFNKSQRDLLDTVTPVPLHRIYGQFDMSMNGKPWFYGIPRTTTHHKLRQFIPMNENHGIAMVSYSDSTNANLWKTYADQGTGHLQKEILDQLQVVFPNISNIPTPKWLESYYWPEGVHFWKKGVESEKLVPEIQQILGNEISFYIVGEAYAQHQGWIEGALESVEAVMSRILRKSGGKNSNTLKDWLERRNKLVKNHELKHVQKRFPEVKWVLIQHPITHDKHMIDVTEWMYRHPGGDVFTASMYKDITKMFLENGSHYASGNETIKSSVMRMLDLYTIGFVV